MNEPVELLVYGRPGCHLCDEAVAALEDLAGEVGGMAVREVDIESDQDLFRRYLEKIPVVVVGGRVVTELESSAKVLRRELASSGLVGPLRDGYAERR